MNYFFNHRGTEDSEKSREGILQHDKHLVMRVGEHINMIRQDGRNERCKQPAVFAKGEFSKLMLSKLALHAFFEKRILSKISLCSIYGIIIKSNITSKSKFKGRVQRGL